MRQHVRVRVQIARVDGSWDTRGTEVVPVRGWLRWCHELQEWADERGVRLVWEIRGAARGIMRAA